MPECPLNAMSLRLATQCLARWRTQSVSDVEYMVRTLAYKALVDYVVVDRQRVVPENAEILTGRHKIKRRDFETFESYVSAAAKCISIQVNDLATGLAETHAPTFDLCQLSPALQECYRELHPRFNEIRALQSLQLLAQPVLESCVLIDRLLFVLTTAPSSVSCGSNHEGDRIASAMLCPLFTQDTSPRNVAIIAKKPHQQQEAASTASCSSTIPFVSTTSTT